MLGWHISVYQKVGDVDPATEEAQGKRIAGGVRNNRDDTTTGESFDWMSIDSRSELLERKSLVDILAEYRKAVAMAGSLCVTAYATELLRDVDGLPELIAAMELREWRGLVHSHANLFAR
jgi:hypothetical protein